MNSYPEFCHEVGLACEPCVEAAAQNLAKVCKGLQGQRIGQMFVQIHSDPACSKMHARFTAAYLAASKECQPVMSERPLLMAAVA
jgi:hypothetical protein